MGTSPTIPPASEGLEQRAEALTDALKKRAQAEAELRRSRNLLSMAVDIAQVGTWAYDGELDDVEANARWYVLHGLRQKPRQLSELYTNLTPDDRRRVERGLDEVFSGAVVQWEGTYRTTGGRWIQSRMQRLTGADAGIVMGTALDVTAQERAASDLQQRVELQDLLVGVASHDLKTPLMTIQTAFELLPQLGEWSAAQRQTTARGVRAVERANRLVHDLLDVTRHRLSGAIPMSLGACSVTAVAREAVSAARLVSGDEFEFLFEAEGTCVVSADRARVQQVVANLVDNAVMHATPSQVRVEVRPEARGEHDGVALEVWNPGEPIDPALLSCLFEPFQRGRQARATRKNLGLGLHIVQLIVTQHGGEVEVTSDAGGTRFRVWWRASGPEGTSSAAEDPRAG